MKIANHHRNGEIPSRRKRTRGPAWHVIQLSAFGQDPLSSPLADVGTIVERSRYGSPRQPGPPTNVSNRNLRHIRTFPFVPKDVRIGPFVRNYCSGSSRRCQLPLAVTSKKDLRFHGESADKTKLRTNLTRHAKHLLR